ncbi:hypothetical protein KC19_2G044900, partial [Ceratodon purpureus]
MLLRCALEFGHLCSSAIGKSLIPCVSSKYCAPRRRLGNLQLSPIQESRAACLGLWRFFLTQTGVKSCESWALGSCLRKNGSQDKLGLVDVQWYSGMNMVSQSLETN